jgi:aryl-alcohol dehydrogenase-like predicted oxidoreductase
MELRRLGSSGLLVSAVGLGTNNFGSRLQLDGAQVVVNKALDLGVNFIDTADSYGRGRSEEILGESLGKRRHEALIATKFGNPMGDSPYERGASRSWIIKSAENSLKRLKTDYIDLYQVHRPDPGTPHEETLQALDDLVKSGKVRYVGHSNFKAWQISDLDWRAQHGHYARPVSAQHQYSLIARDLESEVIPACEALGLGVIPFSPLGGGFLTGKYERGSLPAGARLTNSPEAMRARFITEANYTKLDGLNAFAKERGITMLDIAIGWLLRKPVVSSVIAGAMTAEQLEQNAKAGEWRPTREDEKALNQILAD